MRGTSKVAVVGVASLALALAGCGGGDGSSGGSASEGVTADEVSIGTISDRTGPSSGTQVPWLHGLESVVERVNSDDGVAGRTIKLISEDEKTDVSAGLAGFKKLTSQTPVVGVLGANSSSIQAAIVPELEDAGITLLAGQATIKDSLQPFNEWFFGLAPTYADQVDVMLARATETAGTDVPKIATVALAAASGVEFVDLVTSRCDEGKCELVDSQEQDIAATTADAQVQSIAGAKPDVVMFHGSSAGANVFMRSQEKFGTDIPTVAITPAGGPAAFATLKPATVDLYESVQWTKPTSIETAGTEQLVADAEAAGYGDETDNVDFVAGYVTGLALVEALEIAGEELTRETLKDAMAELSLDTEGLTGTIEFSDDRRVGSQSLYPMGFDPQSEAFIAKAEFEDYADAITGEYLAD